ncbi:hypothetical protein MTR67_023455 [Solanum verrucosum]|uniref:Uncharacterized protein n=1 Tax=Solanum verrucosum TaxID=315347 RepID=A0AAF0TXM9_SOLVR|nr:hypothetical protein MTR67_023455 [Solanum verrucosum]
MPFPFSLMREGTKWLIELPPNFIISWEELTDTILERSLDGVIKGLDEHLIQGGIVRQPFVVPSRLFDDMTKTNRAWHTIEDHRTRNQGWNRSNDGSREDPDWCDRRESWEGSDWDRENYVSLNDLTVLESAWTEDLLAKILNKDEVKDLSINFPLVDAFLGMPGAIMTNNAIAKKEDPWAFTIPCTIGACTFAKALCDLGVRKNLIPWKVFNNLGIEEKIPTNMRLLMDNRSINKPVGVVYDILVKVDKFVFPSNFVILDYEIDIEIPVILGRPFLAIGKTLVDIEGDDLK